MKIGIDLHTVNNLFQGSRTYVYNLTRALLNIDKSNEYYLYLPPDTEEKTAGVFQQENVNCKVIRPSSRSIRLTIAFPARLAMDKIDIFHCQYMGPLLSPCPYVETIHDIIHETHPQFYPMKLKRLMKFFYPLSARKASRILTGSEYTKEQIRKLYKVPEERIDVTPYGASSEFRMVDDTREASRIAGRYGIEGPYILFVGRIEPRKNIFGLIRAYHLAKSRYNIAHKLVIVGMKDPLFEDFHRQVVHEERNDKDVLIVGGIEQEHLPYIYNGADLFVYPSFAEGFGLPVLEAMACGVPVLTSNTASLPEVAGDAGMMIDPGNDEQLATAIRRILGDSTLRSTMRENGLKRAKLFSWHQTAERVLQIYREVYEGR